MWFRFTLPTLMLLPLVYCGCTQPVAQPKLTGDATTSVASDLVEVSLDVLPPGTYHQKLQLADGTALRYTICIPAGHSQAQPTPLILALHFGTGGQGRPVPPFYGHSMLDVLVKPGLQELGAIMIAPDSIAGRWNNETNETAVLQLIDHVVSKYNIDQRSTLVTGFSMGGSGTWYFAGRHQDRFSAAIPIAARPGTETEWKIPLYVIQSRNDGVIPLDRTEAHVKRLEANGADVQLVVIEGVTHYETARFAEPLREAVPWIRKVWAESRESRAEIPEPAGG